jgi:outer membrane lipopolysaccharide assembly protein LptE/RlpB
MCGVMGRPRLWFVVLLALPVCIAGCGYRFARYPDLDGNGQRICVVTLQNDSQEAGVELLATEALRHEILSRGGLELISDPQGANYTLRGRVARVQTRSRSFTGVALAREYEVTLRIELQIDSVGASGVDMPLEIFEAGEIYFASADVAALGKNRREALRYLSGLLASRVHDSLDRKLLSAGPR